MNTSALLADSSILNSIIPFGLMVVAVLVYLGIWASRYTKVGPNEVLIVSGKRRRLPNGSTVGFRIVKGGGGTFVYPVIEKADVLSLEVCKLQLTFPKIFAANGARIRIEGEAQIKIKSDDTSLVQAAEHFIPTGPRASAYQSRETMQTTATALFEKHLNSLLAAPAGEEALRNPAGFAALWHQLAADDFGRMGLDILSLVVRDIQKISPVEG